MGEYQWGNDLWGNTGLRIIVGMAVGLWENTDLRGEYGCEDNGGDDSGRTTFSVMLLKMVSHVWSITCFRGFGFRFWDFGSRFGGRGLGFRVWGLGFGVWGLGFEV